MLLTERSIFGTIHRVFILSFLLRIAANIGALWLSSRLLDGFRISLSPIGFLGLIGVPAQFHTLIIGGTILALLFLIVRPILKILSFPLILITFGLFNIVISIILLVIADRLSAGISIEGLTAYLFGALIIAAANTLIASFIKASRD